MNDLLTKALILDILHEQGLIKQETISETLDQMIIQEREQLETHDDE